MKYKLQRARSLSPGDWGILAEAWLTLSWIDFAVSFLPYRWWKSWLGTPRDTGSDTAPGSSHDINRLVRLLDAAANHHPRKPTCLRRSLGLKRLLGRRGIASVLRIGVNKDNTKINAHAWVECGGIVINDAPAVASQYALLPVLTEELLQRIEGPSVESV